MCFFCKNWLAHGNWYLNDGTGANLFCTSLGGQVSTFVGSSMHKIHLLTNHAFCRCDDRFRANFKMRWGNVGSDVMIWDKLKWDKGEMTWGEVRSGQKSHSQVRWDEVSYDEVRWYTTRWDDAWWVKSGNLRWEWKGRGISCVLEMKTSPDYSVYMEATIASRQCSHLLVATVRPWSHYLQRINEFLKANHRRMSCYLFPGGKWEHFIWPTLPQWRGASAGVFDIRGLADDRT